MFNISVDECGKTYSASELVSDKSEAEIGNARKRKYFCMTCVDEKHAVYLKVRRKSTQVDKKTRNYTAKAWFSHHGGGGGGGNSKKYANESCPETAIHCHAKHILCEYTGTYRFETSKCSGCTRHTQIENGIGASGQVEYTETTPEKKTYRFDAVLMRGDPDNKVVQSVLEVWATHETSEKKREYCLSMGYTFAEFHAQHVVDAHEKAVPGVPFMLENLKIRVFECDTCEQSRKQREIRVEQARLLKAAAEEKSQQLELFAKEQAVKNALLVEEAMKMREKINCQFYETSVGSETRIIELQEILYSTQMYAVWMKTNFTRDSDLSPHDLHSGHSVKDLSCSITSSLGTIRDPHMWCEWHIQDAKKEAQQRMLDIKKGILKLNHTEYEKGFSFKCVCAKWAHEVESIPECKRIYSHTMDNHAFDEIVKRHKVWKFGSGSSWNNYEDARPYIKICGRCCTACAFCGADLLVTTAALEGQCKSCSRSLVTRMIQMKESSFSHMKDIMMNLYDDINLVYCGDAFRGFFDFAVEHRVRMQVEKTRLAEFYRCQQESSMKRKNLLQIKNQLVIQKQEQQAYRLKSQQEFRMLREQKQEQRWLSDKIK